MSYRRFFTEVMSWYKKNNLDVFIHGSTLLNIVRRGTVLPRKGLLTDKEINIGILAEDFNDDALRKLGESYGYVRSVEKPRIKHSGYYYAKSGAENLWSIEPGFVFLTILHRGGKNRFKHHGHDNAIVIPPRFLDKKREWSDVEVYGKRYKAPAKVGEYLDYYYGNWTIEDRNWNWGKSPNFVRWDDLVRRESL